MNPKLVCVATISKVVGNLLRIRFDGWDENYDQWLSHDSCDLYPVGWCELVQHKLEPPYGDAKPVASGELSKYLFPKAQNVKVTFQIQLLCTDQRIGSRKRRGKNQVIFKTVPSAGKNESFSNEGSTAFQTPLVSTLSNTVIPNCANVDEVILPCFVSPNE